MSEENKAPASPAEEAADAFVIRLPDDPESSGDQYLWAGFLALLVLISFWPSVPGLPLWDDDRYVTRNQSLRDVDGLEHIWLPPVQTVQYYPLTFTSFWIEYHLWEKSPLGYRVDNLLLQAGSGILLWRILRRLSVPGAWVIAAAWAIHPLQVESVAWITERKNVLSGILALASVLFYLDWCGFHAGNKSESIWKLPKPWHVYALSLVFFVLALLAKTVASCVPPVLLLILWWKRRLNRERFMGLIPMFVIGLALSMVTADFETSPTGLVRAFGPEWPQNFPSRVLIAGRAVWFYIAKLFVPINLSFNYRRVLPDTSDATQWLMAAGVLVVLGALFALRNKVGRGPFVAFLCYLAALFPSMGFFNVYPFRFSFVADHFQYLAGIPVIAATIGTLAGWISSRRAISKPGGFPLPPVLAGALVILLGALSLVRAGVFVDTPSLWQDTLWKNPDSWLAAGNYARDQIHDARSWFDQAAQAQSSGDPQTADQNAAWALAELADAERLLGLALNNPALPDQERTRDLYVLAEVQNTRMLSPKTDRVKATEAAEAILSRAIEQEKKQENEHPDSQPFYSMGQAKLNAAELAEISLPVSATQPSTQPTTLPTTRSTTRPAEDLAIIDQFNESRGYLRKAMLLSERQIESINTRLDGVEILANSAFQRGNAGFDLASFTSDDPAQSNVYKLDAIFDYNIALKYYSQFEPQAQQTQTFVKSNIEAHYRLALCLMDFKKYKEAEMHLKVILFLLDPRYAMAYLQLGTIYLNEPDVTTTDLETAVECFKTAASIDSNLNVVVNGYLAQADKIKAEYLAKHPTTRSTTQPATKP